VTYVVSTRNVVDVRPAPIRMRGYAGNPFVVTVLMRVDGQAPPDLTDWLWRAEVRIENAIVPFQTRPLPDGVQLSMGGADTQRIAVGNRYWRFDLYGRNPLAADGYTILSGFMKCDASLPLPPNPPFAEVPNDHRP
jgi:hypothetical protein